MYRHLLVFSFLTASAIAGSLELTLDDAPRYAWRNNLSLVAARLRIDEARGRLHQSGRLANPELELEFSQNTRMPERSGGLTFVQKFPLTSRLRLEKAVSRAQLAAAEAEVRDAERKLAASVQTAAVRVLAIGGQRALREKQITNSRELAEFTRKRVATGEASVVDASQLELDVNLLDTELLQLDVERATMLGELRLLLGFAGAVQITGELPAPGRVPGAGPRAYSRPDLDAAERNGDAAAHGAALARAQKWEDIGVGLTAQRERSEDAPEGFSNDTFVGLKLSLPLPLWNDNSGRVREATAAAARAGIEVIAIEFTIRREAEAARGEMVALAKLVAAMDGGLLPKAAEVEDRLRQTYAAGQTPLLEVLRARDRRLQLQRQRVDAVRDFHLARIRHASAIGQITPSAKTSKQ